MYYVDCNFDVFKWGLADVNNLETVGATTSVYPPPITTRRTFYNSHKTGINENITACEIYRRTKRL